MIGQRVVLALEEPLHTNHCTTFRAGQTGVVVGKHPRWHAFLVWIDGHTAAAVFFPDEIQEIV